MSNVCHMYALLFPRQLFMVDERGIQPVHRHHVLITRTRRS